MKTNEMSAEDAVHAAQKSATAAYNFAMGAPNAPRGIINKAWSTFQSQTRSALDPSEQIGIAADAERLMRAFAETRAEHLAALTYIETLPNGWTPEAGAAAERAWASHPV